MAAPPRPAFVVWNPLTTSIYDSITEYLSSPDRDARSAATELTSLMSPYMSSASDIQNVCHLWGVIFFMATTYHPSSPRHSLLVDLVLEIRKCSAPPVPGHLAYEKQWGCSFWMDLPMWRAVWNDYEFDAPLVPRMGERESDRSLLENQFLPGPWRNRDGGPMVSIAWASLNAFGARVHAQTDLALLDVRALFALMEALEDERSARALDDVVPAAACWILYAGKKIKENHASYETDHDVTTSKNRLQSRGILYNGPRGFSDARWDFWKTRFGTLAERMDLKRNTRIYAKQAMNEMQRLDSVQSTSTSSLSQQRTPLPNEVVGEKRQMGPTIGESSRAPSRRVLVSDLIN